MKRFCFSRKCFLSFSIAWHYTQLLSVFIWRTLLLGSLQEPKIYYLIISQSDHWIGYHFPNTQGCERPPSSKISQCCHGLHLNQQIIRYKKDAEKRKHCCPVVKFVRAFTPFHSYFSPKSYFCQSSWACGVICKTGFFCRNHMGFGLMEELTPSILIIIYILHYHISFILLLRNTWLFIESLTRREWQRKAV